MKDLSRDFSDIYDTHVQQIYDFLYFKTFDKTLAEDLTSTTFMKAFEHYGDFRQEDGATVKSWLYRIARNTAIDHYRTRKNQVGIEEASELPGAHSLADIIETKMKLDSVTEELQKLPEKDRDIIIMRVWQELSYKEIGLILDKSEASSKMAFSRAIRTLRTSLTTLLILLTFGLW